MADGRRKVWPRAAAPAITHVLERAGDVVLLRRHQVQGPAADVLRQQAYQCRTAPLALCARDVAALTVVLRTR